MFKRYEELSNSEKAIIDAVLDNTLDCFGTSLGSSGKSWCLGLNGIYKAAMEIFGLTDEKFDFREQQAWAYCEFEELTKCVVLETQTVPDTKQIYLILCGLLEPYDRKDGE